MAVKPKQSPNIKINLKSYHSVCSRLHLLVSFLMHLNELLFLFHITSTSLTLTLGEKLKNASLSPLDSILEGFYTIAHSEHESILSSQGYHEPSRPI